eukprot:1241795-Prymnesium_polylepis.1
MLGKLKKPPPLLKNILTCVVVLLGSTSEVEALADAGPEGLSWASIQTALRDGPGVKASMAALNLDRVTPQQIAALEPFLETIEFDQVASTLGFAASVWLWVTAVAVICGAVHGVLPDEQRDADAVVARRRRSSLSSIDSPLDS